MANPSPTCEVKVGSAAYVATADGVDLTPGATIIIRLASQADVDSWSITCVTTDETSSASTVTAALSIDSTNKTATFTAPAPGKAYRFRSRVNQGIDRNGVARPSYETTFCLYTRMNGRRVMATDETTEGDTTFGWISWHNDMIRSTPSGVASGLWGSGGGGGGGGAVGVNYQFQYYSGGSQLGATGLDYDPTSGRVLVNRGLHLTGTAVATMPALTVASCIRIGGSGIAATGILRLPNNQSIAFSKADGSGDVMFVVARPSNNLLIGDTQNPADIYLRTATGQSVVQQADYYSWKGADQLTTFADLSGTGLALVATGGAQYVRMGNAFIAVGTGAANTGAVRLANNQGIYANKTDGSGDILMLKLAGANDDFVDVGNGAQRIRLLSGSGGAEVRGDVVYLQSGGGTSRMEISASGVDFKTGSMSTQNTRHRPYSEIRSFNAVNATPTGIYYWTIKDEAITSIFAEVNGVASGGAAGGSYARRLRIHANGGVASGGAMETTWNDEYTGQGYTGFTSTGIAIGHSGMTGFVNVQGTPTGNIWFGLTVTRTETSWAAS